MITPPSSVGTDQHPLPTSAGTVAQRAATLFPMPATDAYVADASAPDLRILAIDDEPANIALLRRILAHHGLGVVLGVSDPREAMQAVRESAPDLIVLDFRMPHMDGIALLRQITATVAPGEYLPVVMITGDNDRAVREEALALGARDFIAKPFDVTETVLRIRNLLETRRLHLSVRHHSLELEERVVRRTADLEAAQYEMLERLARAAEYRDDDTGEHTRRVGELAACLAREAGLPEREVDLIRRAAPLHDIGKIGVPDAILLKPGRLTAEEVAVMRRHTTIGAALLADAQSVVVQVAGTIALSHHERWDGTGYPAGRAGEAIPLPARIVAVADFYDALTHDRPYRAAVPAAVVRTMMQGESGRHFDPELLDVFLARCVRDATTAGAAA